MSATTTRSKGKRLEAAVTDVQYAQMQVLRIHLGIPSDADFVRAAIQAFVDTQSDSITSARYFTSSFRDAVRRLEDQQRLLSSVLLVAFLRPEALPGVLGKQVEELPFMDAKAALRALQALMVQIEHSVEQT